MTCLAAQPVAAADFRAAGRAAAKLAAFCHKLRSGGTMDGAIDAAAAQQRAVGRVDDRIERKRGDIGDADIEPRDADFG